MKNEIIISQMSPQDWNDVREIYIEGIATKNATFQKDAPSWEQWDLGHIAGCRIVAKEVNEVVGWAALSPVSSRLVYSGVAEVSLYVNQRCKGKGIGSFLLKSLIEQSEGSGFWMLQSSIFPENYSSIYIHKKNGFREVGKREKIAKLDEKWRDVILLERRSNKVGID
ncbi:phosphinothricin acetyltransferase [Metabacillus crassostreae]|uniref:GNAT family N-acetyltransferase n=1 Tax=Metabacillus crassostreae TaxID=929098 RepID=UPI00195B94BF|nr:GNAT family N-acetyltransferase [Metabacillus crassostreae]MBM7602320.1 phosphinothricin acetyltransferase [Metabacillus crassostreae]